MTGQICGWGMRVLIVEDEGFIALDMESALTDAGCEIVGVAASVDGALTILDDKGCDAAVLDANLGGEDTAPIAAALRARQIPFLVVSGYERQRPGVFADAPFLAKPYTLSVFVATVQSLTTEYQKAS
jgi:DNA-binding response OmpR family regulator